MVGVFHANHRVQLTHLPGGNIAELSVAEARKLANDLREYADRAEAPEEVEMVASDNGTIRFATGGKLGKGLHVGVFPNGKSIVFTRMEAIEGLHRAITLAQKVQE